MNRPIKFRAWNPGDGMYALGPTENFDVEGKLLKNSAVKVMQFTGLLDKNGKEIYEGDIIREVEMWRADRRRKFQERIRIYQVSWRDAGFNVREPDNFRTTLEVIGNTYENPELLNHA